MSMYVFPAPELSDTSKTEENKHPRSYIVLILIILPVHNIWLKFVYCMIRNVHFLFFFFSVPWTCLHNKNLSFHLVLFLYSLFFIYIYKVYFTILSFWWYCVFIYSKIRWFKNKKSDIVECFKLLNTGEGRGFYLLSWHTGLRIVSWIERVT